MSTFALALIRPSAFKVPANVDTPDTFRLSNSVCPSTSRVLLMSTALSNVDIPVTLTLLNVDIPVTFKNPLIKAFPITSRTVLFSVKELIPIFWCVTLPLLNLVIIDIN